MIFMLNLKLRAKNLVKKYGTSDPYYIARELKFEIVFCDMPYKINGMWRRILRRKYIFIDENLNEWQKKAVLCHELGYFLCHKGYSSYNIAGRTFFQNTRKENEANTFSAELMSYSSDVDKRYIIQFLESGHKK